MSSKRLHFLDLFRGTFALLMLEGHTFRALLDSSLKLSPVYQYHELLHNLPGPAFLFASGAAFSLATLAHWDDYRRWGTRLAQRLIRFVALLAIGYMLHLTYFSFRRTLAEGTTDQFLYLFSMDILQCIAAGALLLQLLVWILPGRQWFFRATVLLGVATGLLAPSVWLISKDLPWWLGTQGSGHWGSVFPLFPYVGFQLAGAAWGYLHAESRRKEADPEAQDAEGQFLLQTRTWSVRLIGVSLFAAFLQLPEAYSDFWMTAPWFFFLRVGVLSFLLAMFRVAESRLVPAMGAVVLIGAATVRERARQSWLLLGMGAVALLGRESLLVYVCHLLLLHGSALNPDQNLLKLLGTTRPAGDTALVLLLLTGAMIALCWGWGRLKRYRLPAVGVQCSLAGYLIYLFLSR